MDAFDKSIFNSVDLSHIAHFAQLLSITLLGVDTMEGLTKLMMDMGVVHLNLPCNDNAVLLELAARLRREREKKEANMIDITEDEESLLDDLRTTLRRRPFKAKLRHPKTMVKDITTVYDMSVDDSVTLGPDFLRLMFTKNTFDQ